MEKLKKDVFEALGAASLCWNPRPTGVFDSTQAKVFGDELMEKINSNVPAAMNILIKAMETDEGYRIGWKANIAMAFYDAYTEHAEVGSKFDNVHEVANIAAENFLHLLCSTKSTEFK